MWMGSIWHTRTREWTAEFFLFYSKNRNEERKKRKQFSRLNHRKRQKSHSTLNDFMVANSQLLCGTIDANNSDWFGEKKCEIFDSFKYTVWTLGFFFFAREFDLTYIRCDKQFNRLPTGTTKSVQFCRRGDLNCTMVLRHHFQLILCVEIAFEIQSDSTNQKHFY